MRKINSMMTVRQVARYFNIDEATVYRLINKRKLPTAFKIGNQWRFPRKNIELWQELREQEFDRPRIDNIKAY